MIVWIVADLQVITSSKCRTNTVTAVCGIAFVIAVPSCLIELYRRPSWPSTTAYPMNSKFLFSVRFSSDVVYLVSLSLLFRYAHSQIMND